jgi:cytochrome c biogenesis protein CcdA
MYQRAVLFLACMLAGFGLANIPDSAILNTGIQSFFEIVGGLTVIVFGLALLVLGVKALLNNRLQ